MSGEEGFVCLYVLLSVCLSVRGNPNINLYNTTKPIYLDSLLQEGTLEAIYVCIKSKLWMPKTPSEDSELARDSVEKII